MPKHEWIRSTLGHGETMCKHCFMTNREAWVLGDECAEAPAAYQNPDAEQQDQMAIEQSRPEVAPADVVDWRGMLDQVLSDTAKELGCEPDNEQILFAIADLKHRIAASDENAKLPCDVAVAPATIIRKGCGVSTLLLAIAQRRKPELGECPEEIMPHVLDRLAPAPALPLEPPEETPAVPENVYWAVEHDNFYSFDRKGMGNAFYKQWWPWRDKFPTAPVVPKTIPDPDRRSDPAVIAWKQGFIKGLETAGDAMAAAVSATKERFAKEEKTSDPA